MDDPQVLQEQPTQQPETPEIQPKVESQQPTGKDQNWRELRMMAEREAEQRRLLEAQIAELKAQQNQPSDELDSDDLMEKRQFKRYRDEIKKENQELKKKLEEVQNIAIEESLKSSLPGFYDVVNQSNLDQLAQEDPILHQSIFLHNNMRDRGHFAYKVLKAHLKEKQSAKQQSSKLEENMAKPKAAATSLGNDQSALSTYDPNHYGDRKRWKVEAKYK